MLYQVLLVVLCLVDISTVSGYVCTYTRIGIAVTAVRAVVCARKKSRSSPSFYLISAFVSGLDVRVFIGQRLQHQVTKLVRLHRDRSNSSKVSVKSTANPQPIQFPRFSSFGVP